MLKRILSLYSTLLLLAIYFLSSTSCSAEKSKTESENNLKSKTNPDTITEISVCVVGDLMCHKQQITNAKKNSGYDFTEYYEFVKPYISQADYAIGNLELTCAGESRGFSGYPSFNAPDEYVDAVKSAGFDFLVTSNNHSMDLGEKGLLRTIEQINRNQLGYTGTFISQKDHDSIRILKSKDISFAVLNYTYGTNGAYPEKGNEFMLNVIDSAKIYHDIQQAKKLNPDFVMVFYHFGAEYNPDPNEYQKKAARWAHHAGANIIIGGHPHVVGPCEWILPNKFNKDTAFVCWTMGNYVSNMTKRYTDAGVMITLKLKKNNLSNKKSIQAEYVPTWVYKGENTNKKSHVIFPSEYALMPEKIPSYVNQEMIKKMKQAFDDTKAVINKNKSNFILKSLN
jgi:poly-gamma-glutamate capsule biosynthesis protein CapA/YwtB (metallophosphatase superfamily)